MAHQGHKQPQLRNSAVASKRLKKVLAADGSLTDLDTIAVAIVAGSLDHVAAARVDSDVVDIAEAGAVEDKITGLLLREVDVGGGLVVLVGGAVVDGLAATLIDTVLGETRAVKAHNMTIITIGGLLLDSAISWSVVVATTP